MSDRIEVTCGSVTLREDGIMHVHVTHNGQLNIKEAMAFYNARVQLSKGKIYPVLFTAGKYMRPSRAVRKHMASLYRTETMRADAFVIGSLYQRSMANLYLLFNKPYHPTAIFTNQEDAIQWLKRFVQ